MLLDMLAREGGGAEVFTTSLAIHLPRDRFDVRFCVTRRAEGFLAEELDREGIPRVVLGRRGRLDVLPFRRLRRYLRDERIDVLHTHLFGSNLWGSIVGRSAGVPVVVAHEHTWSFQGHPERKFLDRNVIGRFADAFVAVSSLEGERMVTLEKVPAEKVVVIPPAFLPRPEGEHTDLRAELGIPADAPVVGTAVVLRAQKALDVAIDAFALLLRDVPDAHLVLAGDGPCRRSWERHAMERGVEARVHFIGPRSDIVGVIRALDVATLSSDYEGTPVFLLESMAYGTPVVATDVGGVRDLMGDRAVLVPPRDPAALGAGYRELIQDPARAESLARAARERVDEYRIERIAERVGELYEKLLRSANAHRNGA